MSGVETGVRLASLFGAVCFVLGLHLMNSPATARRGLLSDATEPLANLVPVLVAGNGEQPEQGPS